MHVRCPHCHHPVEILDDAALSDITCPSCDSRFNLIEDETLSYRADQHLTIGHFQLREIIGIGAFGTVWKALDTELDRTVAVKIPRKDMLDAQESEHFFREARAAAQLKHSNIVSVHEVGREGDTIYIVSDFVEGLSLADWRTAQQLTFQESSGLCLKIAEALEHAHQAGVIHRDLKPSNILIDADGEPHIMDFGLAKRESGEITMTIEGQVLGTPAYMSPEQAKGEGHDADARSDVYSLGVILFELLTGERPFRGNKRMLIHQVIHEEAPSPRQINNRVPKDLETICLKCLEKEPARRFQTASELAADLKRYLNGEPILARPVGRLERSVRWCRRNPVIASLIALAVVLLISGTAISSYFAVVANQNADVANRAFENERDAKNQVKVSLQQETKTRKQLEDARQDLANTKRHESKRNELAEELLSRETKLRKQLESDHKIITQERNILVKERRQYTYLLKAAIRITPEKVRRFRSSQQIRIVVLPLLPLVEMNFSPQSREVRLERVLKLPE